MSKNQVGEKNNNYGKHPSIEARERMSESHKGKALSEEHKRKIGEAGRGRKHSEESKGKMSTAQKGRKRGPLSEEHRKKISEAGKGRHHTEEFKIKRTGEGNTFYGKRHSSETRARMSEKAKGRKGEKNPNWKGGINTPTSAIRTSDKYAQWRQDCFIRDDFTCQKCGKNGGDLHVHHKKRFSKLFDEARNYMPLLSVYDAALIYTPMWKLENGVTLCEPCHKKARKH